MWIVLSEVSGRITAIGTIRDGRRGRHARASLPIPIPNEDVEGRTNTLCSPKRLGRFGKEEQKRKSGFSTDFSMVRGPNRVLTPLKSASNIRISSFVPPSPIFLHGPLWRDKKSHFHASVQFRLSNAPTTYTPLKSTSKSPTTDRSFVLESKIFVWEEQIEKSLEKQHYIFCSSFQNLRLGEHKFFSSVTLHTAL